jgi:pyruvate/2-oxoglutarate dehydrogenase complex dihydrolipoamide acyltransferase (E2) component
MAEIEIRLPKLAMTMQEGTIEEWFVAEGDDVTEGQDMCVVSTDKVDNTMPAPASGRIVRLEVEAGETVDVGALLAVIEA